MVAAVDTKSPAEAAVEDKSIAGGGVVEEVVDFWEVHSAVMKMTLRNHCADKSNWDAFDCKELKPLTHRLLHHHHHRRHHCNPNFDYIDSLAAVIEKAELELELEPELELVKASDWRAQMRIAEGKACTRP